MIWRSLTIIAAYLAACVAAGPMLIAGMVAPLLIADSGMRLHLGVLSAMTALAIIIALASGALPALLTVVYAERSGRRSALFYAGAGALSGLASFGIYCLAAIWRDGAAPRLVRNIASPDQLSRLAGALTLFAITGALAGLIYWAIAGRTAGQRRRA